MMKSLETKRDKIFFCVCLATGLAYMIKLAIECLYGVPSFDGAMNLQVPLQMIRQGKYMTTYDGGIVFDGRIQTRLPVLLPIYLIWKLFGISSVSALLVNALYIVLMQYIVWKIMNIIGASRIACYSATILPVLLPCFDELSMGIYGEIPMLALILCAIYWLIKSEQDQESRCKCFVISGLFFSLAVLNKTVALIAMPAFIFMFLIKLIDYKKKMVKPLMAWGIAFIVPIICEEVFRLIQIGGWTEYANGWSTELTGIGQQAGVKKQYVDTPNILVKFWTHLNIFCDDFNFWLGPVVLILILILVFCVWGYWFFIRKKHRWESILLLISCSYFGWWLLITTTQKAWARRILPGAILLIICIVYFADVYLKKVKWNKWIYSVVFCVVATGFMIVTVNDCIQYDYEYKSEIQELATQMKEIDAQENVAFYGIGWWQAPILAFYSGIDLYDLENAEDISGGYFVLDDAANRLSDSFMKIDDRYELELVAEARGNKLYKISEIEYENHVFKSAWEDEEIVDGVHSVWEAKDEYDYIEGVYSYEESNDGRWASRNVEVILDTRGKDELTIDFFISGTEDFNSDSPRVYFYLNGECVDSMSMSDGGQNFTIDITNYQSDMCDFRVVSNCKHETANGDARELSYIIHSIRTE